MSAKVVVETHPCLVGSTWWQTLASALAYSHPLMEHKHHSRVKVWSQA